MSRLDDLAAAFFGNNRRLEDSSSGSGTLTRTETGVAASDSVDGMVYVIIGDETISSETLAGEVGDNSVLMPTTVSVHKGDRVIITLVGTDGIKTPTVTGVIGRGDEFEENLAAATDAADAAERAADAAETAAAEAYAAVETQSENFWADTNGVHVATVADDADTGPNMLANSQGILLRIADKIRTAMTSSGFTIYDGLANLANNIVAQFGSTSFIGKAGDLRMVLTNESLDIVESDGTTSYLHAGFSDSAIGPQSQTGHYPFYTLGTRHSGSAAGGYSTAVGLDNTASGYGSFTAGISNTAIGYGSVAMGYGSYAYNQGAAIGYGTIARPDQLAIGMYNVDDTGNLYSVVYGNGGDASNRSNGWMIDKSGHVCDTAGGKVLKGYTLYDASATGGTGASTGGTISDNIRTYEYVEVFYHILDGGTKRSNSTKALVINGQVDSMMMAVTYGDASNAWFCHSPMCIAGTSWTIANTGATSGYVKVARINSSSVDSKVTHHTSSPFYIDRIIGYK